MGPLSTRGRILDVARDLIREQGYSAASISQIAGRLGTSKAALYYHFKSKEEILEALLDEPLASFQELARKAAAFGPGERPDLVLSEVIDFAAGPMSCLSDFRMDPSVLKEYARCRDLESTEEILLKALVGAKPSAADKVRAKAALAAAKQGVATALQLGGLTPELRSEILSAALRVLDVS